MKRCLLLLAVLLLAVPASAATFNGFLYAKLQAVGSRSEGPAYYLQTFDGPDLAVRKHGMLWQADPVLQRYVGTKVTIEGEEVGGAIDYQSIKPFAPSLDSLKR